jgi:hypothetical protein
VVAAVAVILAAAAGYTFGHSRAASKHDATRAQATAYTHALHQPKPVAARVGLSRGRNDGINHGRAVGLRRGRNAGVQAANNANATAAATPPTAPSGGSGATGDGCPAGLVPSGTQACALPGGGSAGCAGDPYSTPTRSGGCIGPAHPPSNGPARAQDCPPGQVPVGVTGACAPP